MPARKRPNFLAYLALFANIALWGFALPIVKLGNLHGLDPQFFLFLRHAIAFVLSLPIILLFYRRQFRAALNQSSLGKIFLIEFVGIFVSLTLLYQGLNRTSAIEANLIGIVYPVFIVIGGIIFLKEREHRNEFLGLLVILLGTIVITLQTNSHSGHLLGNALIFTHTITTAAYYLLAKKYYHNLNKWVITHLSFFFSTLTFLVYNIFFAPQSFSNFSLVFDLSTSIYPLLAILYMAIPGSILALTFYLFAQDHIEASEAAVFNYLQPLFSLPAAFILLGESISMRDFLGLCVIAVGLYLANRQHFAHKGISRH